MIVHSVETMRGGKVTLSTSRQSGNHFSVLTGPNGSGKTEILVSIGNIFHGRFHRKNEPLEVDWTRHGQNYQTSYVNRDVTGVARVVAQTFSPFSRFLPESHLHSDVGQRSDSILDRFELPKDEYIGVGFDSGTKLNMQNFSRFIIENGILRLSERPKAARAIFRVLYELDFKEGMSLRYKSDRRLDVLTAIAHNPHAIEDVFHRLRETMEFSIDGYGAFRNQNGALIRELRRREPEEVAEFVRGAIGLIQRYAEYTEPFSRQVSKTYSFHTFQEHGMVSDFSVLQAFSMLRRLGLLQLINCELNPIGHKPIDVTLTSSGQQQLLCSFFGLAAALDDETVVLIDEPELSLHPRWQLNFFTHLEHVLEAFSGCHVILATHSPLITQSAVRRNADIIHLGQEEKATQPIARQNLSVEEALVNIFDTPLPNSLHISNEIFELISKAEAGGVLAKAASQQQLENYLKLYRGSGEEGTKTVGLLEKALRLIANGNDYYRPR